MTATDLKDDMTQNTKDAGASLTILPDGSAFAVASFPLPKDHWLYAERTYSTPDQIEPDDLPAPILTHAQRAAVVAAVRYAVRGATMCGKDDDFDPDALVQNAVYALCGPFGINRPAGDWRADVQKVRDALDPEDWCGDESMIAALDRALGQPSAPTAEQAESTIAAGGAQEPVAGGESRPQNFCGCIEWSSYKNRHGYGTLKADGRISLAHRVMYCDYNGVSLESIQDLVVRHACDNPGCINPAHLLLGTHADNTQDKVERGRQAKGERNGQSKLTSHQVAQIRSLYVRGSREFGTPALARKFGVGETTIRKIILNLRWVHVSSTGDQA